MVQWIEDPTANDPPCPVDVNTLTIHQVQAGCKELIRMANSSPELDEALKFPTGVPAPPSYIRYVVDYDRGRYCMYFAEGVILLSDISRALGSSVPHASSVALALYQQEFGTLNTLRHVFVCTVVNNQTYDQIGHDFLMLSEAGEGQPEIGAHTYLYDTPEYEVLLGTRIPRTVGYLVLGAFGRGDRRIARMYVYESSDFTWDLRCDIEPIA